MNDDDLVARVMALVDRLDELAYEAGRAGFYQGGVEMRERKVINAREQVADAVREVLAEARQATTSATYITSRFIWAEPKYAEVKLCGWCVRELERIGVKFTEAGERTT